MKRIAVSLLLFLSAVTAVRAQGNYREEFENFRRKAISTYSDFRRQCNRQYVEFMLDAWKHFNADPAFSKPKEEEILPIEIDETDPPVIQNREIEIVEVIPVPSPEPQPQPQPVSPVIEYLAPIEEYAHFSFFDTDLSVRVGDGLKFKLKSTDKEDIASAWERLSGKENDNTLYDCLKIREDYDLCDWAYLLMLFSFSDTILGGADESMLLTAYLFSQSGYKMRLGLCDSGIALLFGSKYQIFNVPYYRIDGDFFYQLNGQDKEMEIVDFSFPNEKPLSLEIAKEPMLAVNPAETRQFSTSKLGNVASCSVNTNLVKFFSLYPSSQLDDNPLTRWALYANAPLDSLVKEQLYPSLLQKISGRTEVESLNILLDFVQNAFAYENDEKLWGHDRAFYAEESLFYPYCDCEDRSILFSRLVRDLLGLNVILVYYPGHLATAVNIPEAVAGDYLILGGEKYIVCDPTYFGATIGMTMPDMDNDNASVILLQ